jgi:hypothetical protein
MDVERTREEINADTADAMALWKEWIASPEGAARERVHDCLQDMLADETIAKSSMCVNFLIMVDRLFGENLGCDNVFDLVAPLQEYFDKTRAKEAVAAKLSKDPKQTEKEQVKECWKAWRLNPNHYDSKAAFALDMLTKFESLKSTQVIERWCRTWERAK